MGRFSPSLGSRLGAHALPRSALRAIRRQGYTGRPRACGGIGRRARLRALWTDWSVEVRVLSGALGKPRFCGVFTSGAGCGDVPLERCVAPASESRRDSCSQTLLSARAPSCREARRAPRRGVPDRTAHPGAMPPTLAPSGRQILRDSGKPCLIKQGDQRRPTTILLPQPSDVCREDLVSSCRVSGFRCLLQDPDAV